jgi:hypothetical protein
MYRYLKNTKNRYGILRVSSVGASTIIISPVTTFCSFLWGGLAGKEQRNEMNIGIEGVRGRRGKNDDGKEEK